MAHFVLSMFLRNGNLDTLTFELPNAFTIHPPVPDITMKLIFLAIFLPASILASDADCELCVELVTAVEDWVEAGDTMEDIIEQGVAWCSAHVTGVMNSVCDRIIEQFLPDIVDGIFSGVLDPCGICHTIGLCEQESCAPTTLPPTQQPSTRAYLHIR